VTLPTFERRPEQPPVSRRLFAFLAALLFAGCSRGPETPPSAPSPGWFEDVTDASGLQFTHDPGLTGTYFMPQSMGSGAAALDFDDDGLLDVLLLNFGGANASTTNRLFRQTAPGKFSDVSKGCGLDVPGQWHGVAVGDVNNDGRVDVVLTSFGGIHLFLNRGDGKFTDATADSGLVNPLWGMSAAFLDFDRDGWLDLFVANYLDYDSKVDCKSPEGVKDFCGPNSFSGVASKLFRNRGNGTFEDVSLKSGIGTLRGPGLGVATADFDGDGWPDIFVANDGQPNRLWMNQRNGTFANEAVSRGIAYNAMGRAYAGMGIATGDANGDGLTDLYVSHLGSEQNNLWRQGPRGQFRDFTGPSKLASTKWRGTGFGTLMADFNRDGHLDIAVANGKVHRGGAARDTALGFWETYAEKNQLFVNDGTGAFDDASEEQGGLCGYWNVARGLVAADFDRDGSVDLLVAPIGDKARLLRNTAAHAGNWLQVRAFDPKLKRDAYGAEVRIRAGGREQVRIVNPAESYLSSGSPLAHFGLGAAGSIEWIRITWPDGSSTQEVFPGGAANRILTLKRGEGKAP
jgi:hypothetical protein